MTSVLLGNQGTADSTNRTGVVVGGAGWSSPASNSYLDQVISSAGTLQNLRVLLSVAPGSGKSYTVTLYKNGSSTGITVTISDSATSGSDTTHTVTVAAGDKIRYQYTTSGTPATTQMNCSLEYVGDTADESQIMCCGPSGFLSGGATDQYIPINGAVSAAGGSDQTSRQLIATAGTIKKLYVVADANVAVGKTVTFTLVVNGTPSALTCTMSAGSSTANDTTHSVTVAAGDTLSLLVDYSGVSTGISLINVGCTFVASTPGDFPLIGGTSADPSTSATNYHALNGADSRSFVTTENQRQACASVWYIKNLYTKVSTAPGSGKSWSIKLRKNAADTALTNSIADAATTANAASSITLALYDALTISTTPSGTPTGSGEFYWAMTGTFSTPSTAWEKTVTDTSTVTTALVKTATKVLSNSVTVSTLMIKSFARAITNTLALVDSALKTTTKTFSNTVASTTDIVALKILNKVVMDTVAVTTDLVRSITKVFSNSVTTSTLMIKDFARILAETVTATEAVAKTLGKTFAEAVSVVDSYLRSITKLAVDQVTVSDSITKLRTASKTVTDTITATTAILRSFARTITETVRAYAPTRMISLVLNSSIINLLWRNRTKPSTTWTKRTKPSSIWTKREIP